MPYGGTTPEQDSKIEKMVSAMMADPKFKAKYPDPKTRKSHAIAIAKSKVMGKESYVVRENVPLKFTARIAESAPIEVEEGKKPSRSLKGTLLLATTSRNGITYEFEEIHNAKFNGTPFDNETELTMSLNHTDDVTDNVGLWKPVFNEGMLDYEAKVFDTGKHPYVTEMIDKRLFRFVSVEALAHQLVEDKDKRIARGLDITGMGIIKTPGVVEASLALAEAFDKFKSKEEDKMAETEKNESGKETHIKEDKDEDSEQESVLEKLAEKIDKLATSKATNEELAKKIEELEKKISEQKESKGRVTPVAKKEGIEVIVESNSYKPGTKDIFAKKSCY